MSTKSLLFGDIFLYKTEEYIFLTADEDVWYVARILSEPNSIILKRAYNRAVYKNKALVERMLVYCFVELSTKEFQGRVAHFKDSQKDNNMEIPKILEVGLNDEDKKEIATEILRDNTPVPLGLKAAFKKLDIKID